jgi:hypothetical protein
MPLIEFDGLPDAARVWVFASDVAVPGDRAVQLLAAVDAYLRGWQAHGAPLTCARAWREDRFLAVGVDPRTAGASGCSVDGLFRVLQREGTALGAQLMPSGRVYWRDAAGALVCGDRASFAAAARAGEVGAATMVFDTSVTDAGAWRSRFECAASAAWHRALLPA